MSSELARKVDFSGDLSSSLGTYNLLNQSRASWEKQYVDALRHFGLDYSASGFDSSIFDTSSSSSSSTSSSSGKDIEILLNESFNDSGVVEEEIIIEETVTLDPAESAKNKACKKYVEKVLANPEHPQYRTVKAFDYSDDDYDYQKKAENAVNSYAKDPNDKDAKMQVTKMLHASARAEQDAMFDD